jgi:type I restriction enzyme S subunit
MSAIALSEICDLITDGTHYTPPDIGSGVPFLTVKDMSASGLDFKACSRISYEEFIKAKAQNSAPRRGDILFSKDGTVGKVHVVVEETDFAVLSSIAILRPDPAKLDARFAAHYLRSPEALAEAAQRKTGSALTRIILKDLKQLRLPLPPLDEQKRIAAILDQADELRRKRQRAIDRLNQLRQAIFHEMFGDFVTNPMGWSTVKLGDACGVGSSKRVFVEEFVDVGVPFYRGTEVGKLATGELIEPDLFIAPHHYFDLIAHSGKPEIGDLLLPSICHDGRIWRVDNEKPFYFKDGRVLWIKKNEAIFDSEYLRNHLRNAFLTNYHTIASGTTFAELKIVNLKSLSVLCPPLKLQVEFSKRMREVETTSLEMTHSASVANVLFSSLQHRAFRGEL